MTTVSNKTQRPVSIPLPGGKTLYLGPGKTGQIAMKAVDDFLTDLKKKGTQKDYVDKMQTRKELYALVNYPQFTAWENLFLPAGGVNPLSRR